MRRVVVIALNKLMTTPIKSESAKPCTKLDVKKYKTAHVIIVDAFESLMDVHALRKPSSIAAACGIPFFNSSFVRSNTSMFASTAMPMDRMNPAIPESVIVIGTSLYTPIVIAVYTRSAIDANTPSVR